jgi:hypothetical protein
MVIWFAMLIPFVVTPILWACWPRRLVWWELLLPICISFIMTAGFKQLGEVSETTDTEYWTGWVVEVAHYERWNEAVSCRHPKYKTDSKGKQVQDGYQHLYDVDDHPEYWEIIDSTGYQTHISHAEFNRLCEKFGNKNFMNMHRSFHTINGNKYTSNFPGPDEKLEASSHMHSYENRVQASSSVFKFRKIEKEEKEERNLFDYPEIKGHHCSMILGYTDSVAEHKLELLNARLGNTKQIRVWITVYHDSSLETALAQQSYWQGGNKNELILAVGIDAEDKVQWGYVYSWTEKEVLKAECRDKITDQEGKKLNLSAMVDEVRPLIEKDWERKHFRDFNYLTVEPPNWCIWTTYITTILSNILISVWVVNNKFNPFKIRGRYV